MDPAGYLIIEFKNKKIRQNWEIHTSVKMKDSARKNFRIDKPCIQENGVIRVFSHTIKEYELEDPTALVEIHLDNKDKWYLSQKGTHIEWLRLYFNEKGNLVHVNEHESGQVKYLRFNYKKYRTFSDKKVKNIVKKRLSNHSHLL